MKKFLNKVVESSFHDKPIVTDVIFKPDGLKKPVVIFCHGYKGYKDWGAWNLAADRFVTMGFFFVKFNFSHNGGTLENPIDFPDLEAFGKNNYKTELNDLEDVLKWVINTNQYESEKDINNITLIGHSRGGGIVSLTAAKYSNIKSLITWAGVSDFGKRFPKGEALAKWESQGVSYVLNGRTQQEMPHLFQFYQNFQDNEDQLTIKNALEKLNKPHLIIHGEKDEVVLPDEAKNMHRWSRKSELVFIKDMNHPLGCSQPWEQKEMPLFLEKAVELSIQYILKGTSKN